MRQRTTSFLTAVVLALMCIVVAAHSGHREKKTLSGKILADYPYLEAEDIAAVLEFAARQNDHPVLRSA